jgi:hypothetical protein
VTKAEKIGLGVVAVGVLGGPGALVVLLILGVLAAGLWLYLVAATVGVFVLGLALAWLVNRFPMPPEGMVGYWARCALGLFAVCALVYRVFTASFAGGLVLGGLTVSVLIAAALTREGTTT